MVWISPKYTKGYVETIRWNVTFSHKIFFNVSTMLYPCHGNIQTWGIRSRLE